jgi:hypothetical protein
MAKVRISPFINYKGQRFVHAEAKCHGINFGEFGRTASSARRKMKQTLHSVEFAYKHKKGVFRYRK